MYVLELLINNCNKDICENEISHHNKHDPKDIVNYSLWIQVVHEAGPWLAGARSEKGSHRQVKSTEICIRADEAKFTLCNVAE
jgi:hypothetical protein